MARASSLEDNLFPVEEAAKPKRGRQEDGTYITSSGEVLPAKDRERREPYPEPEDKQVPGNEELVESGDGKISFAAVRMTEVAYKKAGFPNRKRLELYYQVTEIFAGQPRPYYSYDELEQLRRGELKR